VYDNTILGEKEGDPRFGAWFRGQYLVRYPQPPRDESPIGAVEAAAHGFRFIRSEEYSNTVAFTLDRFVEYIMTQSNVASAIAKGRETTGAARDWFTTSLKGILGPQESGLRFGGYIWYLKRL
jgi:hypothetical protein